MAANKPTTTERDDELASARVLCPPGAIIYAVTRQLDRNGDAMSISLFTVTHIPGQPEPRIICLDFKTAVILRRQRARRDGGIEVSWRDSCISNRDRAYALVSALGQELHGDPLTFSLVCF